MASITSNHKITVGIIEQILEEPQWHSLLTTVLATAVNARLRAQEKMLDRCQLAVERMSAKVQLCQNSECPHDASSYRNRVKKCGQCLTATYCSKSCQITDWEIHQLVCKK